MTSKDSNEVYPVQPGNPPQLGFQIPSETPQPQVQFAGGYPPSSPPNQTGFPQTYPQGVPSYPPGNIQSGYPGYTPLNPVQPPIYEHTGYTKPAEPYGGVYEPTVRDPELGNSNENVAFRNLDFSDQSIRKAFIRKVYSIVMCQLFVAIIFIAAFAFDERPRFWAMENIWLVYTNLAIYIGTVIALSCCEGARRTYPTNFILLGIFTISIGYILAFITSAYETYSVFIAVGLTAAVVVGLTIFAMQTKYDFTTMGGLLLSFLIVLTLFGIMSLFMRSRVLEILYAALGALLFSFYLIYDTQLIMGGEHKYSISPEDYILAALILYLDIINLFLKILQLIGQKR